MKLVEMTAAGFVRELASEAPAPGGGSAAALAGAMAAGLVAMVARLTLGREKYREAFPDMEHLRGEGDALGARFLALMDDDTAAYNGVLSALKLPKGTDPEKAARRAAVQEATKRAAETPLETLRAAARLAPLFAVAVQKGNPNCVTDAGVGAELCRTAATGAAYNVRVNLLGISDADFAARLAAEVAALLVAVANALDAVAVSVRAALK